MPVVLDDVAGVTGIVLAVVKLADTCVKGVALLRDARQAGRKISNLHAMLQIEQYRLQSWFEEVGLLKDPPEVAIGMKDVDIVIVALSQLQELLTDTKQLKSKYKLVVEPTQEEFDALKEDEQFLRTILPAQNKGAGSDLARIFHRRQSPWRKLRWISSDQDKARQLVADLKHYVDILRSTLDSARRRNFEEHMELVCRAIIATSRNSDQLSMIGQGPVILSADDPLHATAVMRLQALTLRLLPSSTSSINLPANTFELQAVGTSVDGINHLAEHDADSGTSDLRLSKRHINAEPFRPDIERQLAYYIQAAPRLVLIEWRTFYTAINDNTLRNVNRIASLLTRLIDPSFHSLRCIGYLVDLKLHRIGYVYDVPIPALDQSNHSTGYLRTQQHTFEIEPVPLRELIKAVPCPSLDVRIKLAIEVTETVLQLHTCGWLHKALRSDNLLVIRPQLASEHAVLSTDTSVYLTGYAFARSNEAAASTEPSPDQIVAQLYRHPLSLGPARSRYCKAFDLFSIGCVLLELGLWSDLASVLVSAASPHKVPDILPLPASHEVSSTLLPLQQRLVSAMDPNMRDSTTETAQLHYNIRERLEANAGSKYTEMTFKCLSAATDDHQEVLQLEIESLGVFRQMLTVISTQ